MRTRYAVPMGVATTVVAVTVSGGLPGRSGPGLRQSAPRVERQVEWVTRFGGARENCSSRSEADFPAAFTDRRNLVVGPLVLVGGSYTDARTVHDHGGNKFPLLVAAGHAVTVRIGRLALKRAGLAYGELPQGEVTLADTHRSVTFVACRPGKPRKHYSDDGPSASRADGVSVTFWSGFILTRAPGCIPLEVYVDGAGSPRRAGLSLGRRCPHETELSPRSDGPAAGR